MNKNEFIFFLKQFKPNEKYIISNDCTAGFIYKFLGKKFPHPFIWSLFEYNDFIVFIKQFNNINYRNIEIVNSILLKNNRYNIKYKKIWKDTYTILIDNKVAVNYIHHHNKKNAQTIEIKKHDLYFCDMKNYLKETYLKRTNRMYEKNVDDIIILLYKNLAFNDDEFRNLIYMKTKYKKIVCIPHNFKIDKNKIHKNDFIIVLPKEVREQSTCADYLVKNYLDVLEI